MAILYAFILFSIFANGIMSATSINLSDTYKNVETDFNNSTFFRPGRFDESASK